MKGTAGLVSWPWKNTDEDTWMATSCSWPFSVTNKVSIGVQRNIPGLLPDKLSLILGERACTDSSISFTRNLVLF